MRLAITALVVAVVVGWVFSTLPMGTTGAYPAPYPSPRAYPGLFLPVVFKAAGNGPAPILPTATATTYVPWPTATLPVASTPTRTPTRTATPTATATAVPCNGALQQLYNTSFEADFTGWQTAGGTARSSYFSSSGAWSVVFGGRNSASDLMLLDGYVPIPPWADTAALYFDWIMFSTDSPVFNYDSLTASVLTYPDDNLLVFTNIWNTDIRGNWYTARLDLSNVPSLRGRNVYVRFAANTDGTYWTSWNIDRVRFYSACGSTVASLEAQGELDLLTLKGEQQMRSTD